MIVLNNDNVVAFDCDDTLILWNHPDSDTTYKGIPVKIHYKHVEEIKKFHARRQLVIVWSAGGSSWAEDVVKFCGLEKYVHLVMAKTRWVFDDQNPNQWMSLCFRELDKNPK